MGTRCQAKIAELQKLKVQRLEEEDLKPAPKDALDVGNVPK